jgi:hypothetical protein
MKPQHPDNCLNSYEPKPIPVSHCDAGRERRIRACCYLEEISGTAERRAYLTSAALTCPLVCKVSSHKSCSLPAAGSFSGLSWPAVKGRKLKARLKTLDKSWSKDKRPGKKEDN